MSDSFGNTILYNMCKEKPCHIDADVVGGKMWLIGRSYAASPERTQGKKPDIPEKQKNTDSDFFEKIAEIITNDQRSAELDERIKQMQKREYTYNLNDSENDMDILRKTVGLAELLNELIKYASNTYNSNERNAKNNISFVSKYLHFHLRDIVYIMDTYSSGNAKGYPEIKIACKDMWKGYSKDIKKTYKEYAEHILLCHLVAQKLKVEGENFSPRAVDDILMRR